MQIITQCQLQGLKRLEIFQIGKESTEGRGDNCFQMYVDLLQGEYVIVSF